MKKSELYNNYLSKLEEALNSDNYESIDYILEFLYTSGFPQETIEEIDDILQEATLYSEFKDWCEDEDYTKDVIPTKNKFKDSLKKWQSKSRFGLKIGKKGDKCPNGCDSNLKFNLKVC